MLRLLLYFFLLSFVVSCKTKKQSEAEKEMPASGLSGRELAVTHCSRCHAFVAPEFLPKSSWKKVLPAMGQRMGIYHDGVRPDSLFAHPGGDIVRRANVFPEKAILAQEDWQKIEQFFLSTAPDSIPAPTRKSRIRMGLKHFKFREPAFAHRPALTTMVKILTDSRGILFADAKGKSKVLSLLTPALKEGFSTRLESTPIQFYEKSNEIYLTTIGKSIAPTDLPQGAMQRLTKNGQRYEPGSTAIPNLVRPVSVVYGDLNKDGQEDVVACEFGNETGQLSWFANNGRGGYDKHILREKTGAITAIIKDANRDGLPDVFALVAQGDEGIFLYENKGAGRFGEKRLLTFMPLNGSQYMELADFNKDGFDDIVYVCGDNADKTPILKNYHGIYIFLNDGKNNFRQSYFYQLNGAYKAMVRDYDLDGDLDIAAISFFPDYARYPEETFVYLQNKGNLTFDDYSFPDAPKGRWLVMDAGDMDADGDIDLVLGSFVYFLPMGDKTGLGQKWLESGPSVVVLENTIR